MSHIQKTVESNLKMNANQIKPHIKSLVLKPDLLLGCAQHIKGKCEEWTHSLPSDAQKVVLQLKSKIANELTKKDVEFLSSLFGKEDADQAALGLAAGALTAKIVLPARLAPASKRKVYIYSLRLSLLILSIILLDCAQV